MWALILLEIATLKPSNAALLEDFDKSSKVRITCLVSPCNEGYNILGFVLKIPRKGNVHLPA